MASQKHPISGLYEICIGVESDGELAEVQSYFQQFGFGPAIQSTNFDAAQAAQLYGHASPLSSTRLLHTDSDHGLLRIWQWGTTKPGMPACPLRARGRRWGVIQTTDIFNLANHARLEQSFDEDKQTVMFDAERGIRKTQSKKLYVVEPLGFNIYGGDTSSANPFYDDLPSVHEMILSREFASMALYQRHDIVIEKYGKVNYESRFQCSQFVHAGVTTVDISSKFSFYGDVLGLKLAEEVESNYDLSSESMLDTRRDGENRLFITTIDDPRSGTDWRDLHSGRVLAYRWEGDNIPDVRELSKPGCAGMSGYTYRVRDIREMHQRVFESTATAVTDIVRNEFGELAFSFCAPDGYWWQLIEWQD